MKKNLHLLFAMLFSINAVSVSAEAITVEPDSYFDSGIIYATHTVTLADGSILGFRKTFDDSYFSFCGAISSAAELSIPDSIRTNSVYGIHSYPVKIIGCDYYEAGYHSIDFSRAQSVTSLNLPASISRITHMPSNIKVLHVQDSIDYVAPTELSYLERVIVPAEKLTFYYQQASWYKYVLIYTEGNGDMAVYQEALSTAVQNAYEVENVITPILHDPFIAAIGKFNKNYDSEIDYATAILSIYKVIKNYSSEEFVAGYNKYISLRKSIQELFDVQAYSENVVGAHSLLGDALSETEETFQNVIDIESLVTVIIKLQEAGLQYITDASPAKTAKFDITFMLANPDLQGVQDWTKADGWYTDQIDGNSQVMVNEWATSDDGVHDKFYEYWSETAKDNNLFTVYQKVSLPTGKYDFSCYAFASGGNSGDGVYLYANDTQCTEIYDTRLSETSMTFKQTNTNATEVKIGLKVLSGNTNNWMGIGYAHLYKVYDIESDKSAIRASDITLTVPKTTMDVGETMNVSASISPTNATLQEIKWSSSDPFVFSVDKTGRIVAYSGGTAKVIATTLDGSNITKELTITIMENIQEDTRTWTDMSSVITNTGFEVQGNSEGWAIERDGGTSEVRSGCLEFWNNNHFKTSQLIENLPKGHYRLSVQAYHRYGICKKDYTQLQKGEPTSFAYMFVNNQQQILAPLCSYFELTQPNEGWVSPDNGKHWMPNTMESAAEAFAKDAYWNILEFDVERDREDVTIGIALDKYSSTANWCIFTNFKLETNVEVDLGKTYTLSVMDEVDNELSSKVNIRWYDGQGNELGTGSSIGGIKKDTELFYSVLLDQSLGMKYREVIKQKVNKENETVVCQLKPIETLTVHGRVSAYNTALPRVNVSLTQWLNGKYEYEASALTDANGEFSLNAYNDSTVLIVIANGYIDNKTVRRNLNSGGELGDIDMIEVQGKVIALNLSYQDATREGAEPIIQNWYSDTRNIEYTVQNVTKGKEIEDFAIQQGNIVMPTGTDRGDKIQITVRSLNEKFAETTAEGIIADNDTANVDITLLAFGGIEAVYSQKADDNLLAMLYDSMGKLQMRTVSSSSRLTFTNLAAGNYTLVTMGYNGAIGSVSDISDFANMDLVEGTDYVRSTATVRDGYIASVNVASVPELDASKFEYTGMNTSYLPNKTQLVAGSFITLSARLDFKEQYTDKIDDVKVIIDIPEGCAFVPNSVVIGAKPLSHSLNGNKLTITVDKDDIDRRIRFCVIPTRTGTYMTTAYAEFDYKGTKAQPIGQVQFESTSGELFVPSVTKTKTVMLGGIGVPDADVEIYDNESLIGITRSLKNGKWTMNVDLPRCYDVSLHGIYVKYRGENNVVGQTDCQNCLYDKNSITLKKVTMLNTAHPAGNLTPTQYESVWDFENIDTGKEYYSYWPEYKDFTFLIDLSENDTTKVSNVILSVYTTDGDVRNLSAKYDEKKKCFIAQGMFDTYSTPVTVSVDFYYNEATSLDDTERSDDEYTNMENAFASLESYINDNYEISNIANDETLAMFDVYDSKTNTKQLLEVELINPQDINTKDFTYVKDTMNGVNFYLKESMDGNIFEAVIIEDDLNSAYIIRMSSKESSNATRDQETNIQRRGPIAQGAEYAANAIIPYYEYVNGWIDYNFWQSKLPMDDEDIMVERKKAYRLLMNTCPDGKLKLSSAWLSAFSQTYQGLCTEHSTFSNTGYEMLEIWRKELLKQFAFESATLGIGKALRFIPNIRVFKTNSKNAKYWQYLVSGGRNNRERVEDMIENEIGRLGGFLEDQYVDLSISQRLSSWEPSEKSNLIRQFRNLQFDIKSKYQRCGKDDDDDDDKKRKRKHPRRKTRKDDPSGYVYEAVPTNRIEGVKATLYYNDDEMPVQWDAEEYGEVNPQITDESGLYAWDVPQGFWKVVFEKEGYETTETDWLPVPPPQLEINIPMSQAVAPYVENAMGAESGVTLTFSKYMQPNTLTKNGRVTVTCNGEKAKGDVELLNLEENPYNKESYASRIKFVPNVAFKTTDEVIITVKKEVESYAGKQMLEDFVQRVKIESEITDITCDSVMAVDYQGTGVLEVSVLPAAAAKGKIVQVTSTSAMIASTDAQSVTLNDEGKAHIVVSGELPGNAALLLSMEEVEKERYVTVNVVMEEKEAKAPKASKPTGSTIEYDYLLTLSSATQGSTIYYTLDGTCPCDETKRIKYIGPITLPIGQITLQAVAVREGLADSDVATYTYNVQPYSGEIVLNNGWTWASFNVKSDALANVNMALASGTWTTNDEIKNNRYTDSYSVSQRKWIGTLSKHGKLDNTGMFKIHSSQAQTLQLTGEAINPQSVSIAVNPNWNYIAYLPMRNLSVAEALAGYDTKEGDVIKSQDAFAVYSANGGWQGDLTTMIVGQGYMLKRSASAGKTTFNYPDGSTGTHAKKRRGQTHLYADNMNVIGRVMDVDTEKGDSLIAMVNGKVRGASVVQEQGIVFLTIQGDGTENVELVLQRDGEQIAVANAPIRYESNDILGTLDVPTDIKFATATQEAEGITVSPCVVETSMTVSVNRKDVKSVSVAINSISGALVAEAHLSALSDGKFEKTFNLSSLSAGVYLVTIRVNGQSNVVRIIKK